MTRFNILQSFSIGAMLFTSLASAISYDNDVQQQILTANEDKWDSFIGSPGASSGYVMEFYRVCFCLPEYLGPFQVVVNSKGDVASAIYLEGSGSELAGTIVTNPEDMNLITIEDAFNEIQKALDDGVDDLDVTYDGVGGYPSVVSIEWDKRISDSKTYFTIENVVPL